jgi:hypothetical protein
MTNANCPDKGGVVSDRMAGKDVRDRKANVVLWLGVLTGWQADKMCLSGTNCTEKS